MCRKLGSQLVTVFHSDFIPKMNFKNIGNDPAAGNSGGGRPPAANLPLVREPSVYSLTFDEFMSSVGGSGKDFGSMNMDELLKNIWNAEEIQTLASSTTTNNGAQPIGASGGSNNLQKQGSLTLPRTLSQKTVDEVWKDISKDGSSTNLGGPNLPQQRQQTLGEMTLEEFLVRAGVVREDMQLVGKPNGGIFADLSRTGNNNGLGMGFQQYNNGGTARFIGNPIQSSTNLPLNVNGVRTNQQQLNNSQSPQILPKQPAMAYATQVPLMSNNAHLGMNGSMVPGSALQGGGIGMGLGGHGVVHVAKTSPVNQLSSDEIGRSNGDTSSVSPVPFMFNGGLRGRKSNGAVEKVIERRQRRMIKNRESAARSRARKQAYTMELEAEVQKLKDENQELREKQAEIIEIQKNQVMEIKNMQQGVKKICLRRTQTGPW